MPPSFFLWYFDQVFHQKKSANLHIACKNAHTVFQKIHIVVGNLH